MKIVLPLYPVSSAIPCYISPCKFTEATEMHNKETFPILGACSA